MSKFVVVLINVAYVSLVSAVAALPSFFFGLSVVNYFSWFAVATAVQLFIGKLWNYFIDRRIRLRSSQVAAANALSEAVQKLKVTCAYCGTSNLANIYIGEDHVYECEACNETNSGQITTASARVTTPIMPKAELADIFKNLDTKDK